MKHKEKSLIRLASRLHRRLTAGASATASLELPVSAWQRCESALRKMNRSRQRGWLLAAERCRRDLHAAVRQLLRILPEIDRRLESSGPSPQQASASDIYADLLALRKEFDDLSWNKRARTVSVTTEPILLDDIDLGPFEIRLSWDALGARSNNPYRVVALEPNTAASNDSVTHPHVQDEAVCEGEGRLPIRRSLEEGRLLDFFVIVANLLRTYNVCSPYVSLEDWYDRQCNDCGGTICDEESWICDKCETTVCDSCCVHCSVCDGSFCNLCATRCEGCKTLCCNACIKRCSLCGEEFCERCLDDNERCGVCHDRETNNEPEKEAAAAEDARSTATDATLQPEGVGEALVPA